MAENKGRPDVPPQAEQDEDEGEVDPGKFPMALYHEKENARQVNNPKQLRKARADGFKPLADFPEGKRNEIALRG
ncbi:MAG: hypothetical protein OEV94_12065 [Deltaproteobacteria bacterium]|nr:hypothetical protein [Deltaproteobacteria bacterium]